MRFWNKAVFCALLAVISGGCATTPDEDEFMARAFPAGTVQPRFGFAEANGREIHYAEAGEPSLPLVIFVHGTPGSWKAFAHMLRDPDLLHVCRMISLDRPGFGKSGYGEWESSLERQAAVLKPFLEMDRTGRGAILVGHSYGGSIIARAAMDYPGLVGGVVVVAGSLDFAQERVRWYHRSAKLPPVRWAIPKSFVTANEEIFPLRKELKRMSPRWRELTTPFVVIQGGKDKLVKPGNAAFAKEALANAPSSVQYYPEIGHFIPWQQPGLIKSAVLSLLRGELPPDAGLDTAAAD